jgi:hypothetical protein
VSDSSVADKRTFLDDVRQKLGSERGEIFYALCQMAKIGPNDPEAALGLAIASLYVDARELGPELAKRSLELQDVLSSFMGDIGPMLHREMAASCTQALDGTVIEVQRLIKDIVTQESSAAAVVRTSSIDDECKKLAGQMEIWATRKAELQAMEKLSTGASERGPAPGLSAPSMAYTATVGLIGAFCIMIGFFMGTRVHHIDLYGAGASPTHCVSSSCSRSTSGHR